MPLTIWRRSYATSSYNKYETISDIILTALYYVEYTHQGWRKQFYIGQANSGHHIFEYVGKGPPIDTQSVAIV